MRSQTCGNCGAAIAPGAPFCGACGASVAATDVSAASARRSSTFYLAIGAVLAVGIIVVGLVVLGGSSSGSDGSQAGKTTQGQDQATPASTAPPAATTAAATPRPNPTPTVAITATPVPAPTAAPRVFDTNPIRATEIAKEILTGALPALRGPGAATLARDISTDTPPWGFNTIAFNTAGQDAAACNQVNAFLQEGIKGRVGGAAIGFYSTRYGPGLNAPNNNTGAGIAGQGMNADIVIYENASTVAQLVTRHATLATKDYLTCEASRRQGTYTAAASTLPAGPGGVTYAYDVATTTQYGQLLQHWEEYVWAVGNVRVRVTFTGAPGAVTPQMVTAGLTEVSNAVQRHSGR